MDDAEFVFDETADPADMTDRQIADELVSLHGRLNLRTTLAAAVRAGQLLLEMKSRLGHGNYIPWLKRQGLAPRTVQRYVQAACATNAPPTAHLGLEQFLGTLRAGRRAERLRRYRDALARLPADTAETGIVCADSLDYMKSMPSDSVPFVVTDPPYGIGVRYGDWQEADNAADHWRWFRPFWLEIQRVLVPGGHAVVWVSSEYLGEARRWFNPTVTVASCFFVRRMAFWEPLILWRKPGGDPLTPQFTAPVDWFVSPGAPDNFHRRDHPCPKSESSARSAVRRYTLPGATVLDPFAGIGTIPVACVKEGRRYLGIDRHAPYCEVARRRLALAKAAADPHRSEETFGVAVKKTPRDAHF